ncbi:unnamed protein product [Pylaiella littoralis]
MPAPRYCHGLVHDCTVPKLESGWAGNDATRDDQRESSYASRKGRREEEGVPARGRRPSTTDDNGCLARRGGRKGGRRTFERAMPAGSAADVLPHVPTCHHCCPPPRYRIQSSDAKMAGGGLFGRPRTPTPPEAGNADASHSRRGSVNSCIHDEPSEDCWGGASSRDNRARTASVAVMAAAEVEMAAAATATAAADGTTVGDERCVNGGRLSRAAIEAWEAAETWASVLAAATGAVAAGRVRPGAEETMGGTAGDEKGGGTVGLQPTAVVGLEHHHRRSQCDVNAEPLAERGCSICCCCSLSGDPVAMIGICQSAMGRRVSSVLSCGNSSVPGEVCPSAVHRRDSVLRSSSKALMGNAVLQSVGCGRPAMNATRRSSASSTCLRYKPPTRPAARDSGDATFAARALDGPGKGISSTVAADPTTARPAFVVGEVAATVLARIHRGEELWSRRARRAGLAALRTSCTRAGLRKARGAMAAEFCKRTLRIRGLRALEARVKRRKDRAEAAAAAAESASTTAHAFARAHRMRKVVAMLQRNFQARMALRSRDDLADLHFAERRVPYAVRAWRKWARASRSCRNASALATSKWSSKTLPVALARWVGHSLGDEEKRRRLLTWRDALSTKKPPPPPAPPSPPITLTGSDTSSRGSYSGRCIGVKPQQRRRQQQQQQQREVKQQLCIGGKPQQQRQQREVVKQQQSRKRGKPEPGHTSGGLKINVTPPLAPGLRQKRGLDEWPSSQERVATEYTRAAGAMVLRVTPPPVPTLRQRRHGVGERQLSQEERGKAEGTHSTGVLKLHVTTPPLAPTLQPPPESTLSAMPVAGGVSKTARGYVSAVGGDEEGGMGGEGIVTAGLVSSAGAVEQGEEKNSHVGESVEAQEGDLELEGASSPLTSGSVSSTANTPVYDAPVQPVSGVPAVISSCSGERAATGAAATGGFVSAPVRALDTHHARVFEERDREGSEESRGDVGHAGERGGSRSRCTTADNSSSSMDRIYEVKRCGERYSNDTAVSSVVRPAPVDDSSETPELDERASQVVTAFRTMTTTVVRESEVGEDSSLDDEEEEEEDDEEEEREEKEESRQSGRKEPGMASSSLVIVESAGNLQEMTATGTSAGCSDTSAGSGHTASTRDRGGVVRTKPRAAATSEKEATVEPIERGVTSRRGDGEEASDLRRPPRCTVTAVLDRTTPLEVGVGGAATACYRSSPSEFDCTSERKVVPLAASTSSSLSVSAPRRDASGVIDITGKKQEKQGQGQELSPRAASTMLPSATAVTNSDSDQDVRRATAGRVVRGGEVDCSEKEGLSATGAYGDDGEHRSSRVDRTETARLARDVGSDESEDETPPLSVASVSKMEEHRFHERRDLTRTLPGGWLLPAREVAEIKSDLGSAGDDGNTAGVCTDFSRTFGVENFDGGSAGERKPSSSQRTPVSRASTRKSVAFERRVSSGRVDHLRPLSAPRERQTPPVDHKRADSLPISSSDPGVGSVPVLHGSSSRTRSVPPPMPMLAAPFATEDPRSHLQYLGHVGSVLSVKEERGSNPIEQAGVVLTFPASGQTASSELSCISWSVRGGSGSNGSRSSKSSCQSSSLSSGISSSNNSRSCLRSGGESAAGNALEKTDDGGSRCSPVDYRRPCRDRSSVDISEGMGLSDTERAAHDAPLDGLKHTDAGLSAKAISGAVLLANSCRAASLSSQPSPSPTPTPTPSSTRAAGNGGHHALGIPESEKDGRRVPGDSGGGIAGARSGSRNGGGSSSSSSSSSRRRPASSSGGGGGGGNSSGRPPGRFVLHSVCTAHPGSQSSGSRRRRGTLKDAGDISGPELVAARSIAPSLSSASPTPSSTRAADSGCQASGVPESKEDGRRVPGGSGGGIAGARNGSSNGGGESSSSSSSSSRRPASSSGGGGNSSGRPPGRFVLHSVSTSRPGSQGSGSRRRRGTLGDAGATSGPELLAADNIVSSLSLALPTPSSIRAADNGGHASGMPQSKEDGRRVPWGSGDGIAGARNGSSNGGGDSSSSTSSRGPASSSGGGGGNSSGRPPGRFVLHSVSTARPGSQSSGSRRRRGTLEERVSEAFVRQRVLQAGLRKWRTRTASSASQRRSNISRAASALTFTKQNALNKWLAAHTVALTRKASTVARKSRLLSDVPGFGLAPPAATAATAADDTVAVALAIVIVRRWHRRSVAALLQRHTFSAWKALARSSREVERHCRRALARRGLSGWHRSAQEIGRARARSTAIAFFMSRAAGRRRLRAWLQRRRRRVNALRAADEHRALSGTSPAAARQRRQRRRDERLRMEAAWRSWRAEARERAASRSARHAVVAGAENRRRRSAIRTWREHARDRQRWGRSLTDMGASRARRLGGEGLRGLGLSALDARARRDSLRVGDEHWRRRGAVIFLAQLRKLARSRRRLLRRANALRLRIAARAGLGRWRLVVRDTRVVRNAGINGETWWRERAKKAGVSALSDRSGRRVAQGRATRAGWLHFSRCLASGAIASWREWTRRQSAAAELSEAATALRRSWIASAGLRALDRVARARTARREAARTAQRHRLRTRGLERWRAAAASSRLARDKAEIATVHWARNLSAKVLVSWAAAAIQQWAETRQEEAAAQHEQLACKKRALRVWTEVLFVRSPDRPTR